MGVSRCRACVLVDVVSCLKTTLFGLSSPHMERSSVIVDVKRVAVSTMEGGFEQGFDQTKQRGSSRQKFLEHTLLRKTCVTT